MTAIAAFAIDDNSGHLKQLEDRYPAIKTHCFTVFRKRGFEDAVRNALEKMVELRPRVLVLDLKLSEGGSHMDALRVIRKIPRSKPSLLRGVDLIIWTTWAKNARKDLALRLASLFDEGVVSVRVHQKPDFPPIPLPPVAFPGVVNFFDTGAGKYTQ
jgi:hypothetical protein